MPASKFKDGICIQAEVMCKLGAIDEDLAQAFEVDIRTINRWKKRYPEFAKALKVGKDEADAKITASLYKRAVGMKKKTIVKKTIVAVDKFGNTQPAKVETTETEEDVIPDVGAICRWQNNRQPDLWKDKQEIGLWEIEDLDETDQEIYGKKKSNDKEKK